MRFQHSRGLTRRFACTVGVCLIALAAGGATAHGSSALTVTITSEPPATSSSRDATFVFSANELAAFTCSLDGATPLPCTSPVTYSGLADGTHVFTVVARNADRLGTHTARDLYRWTIAVPPTVPIPPPPGPARAQLSVVVHGAGRVDSAPAGISCPGDCTEAYPVGTAVALVPHPSDGFSFAGWSGACSGTGGCTAPIAGATFVRAVFTGGAAPNRLYRGDRDGDGVPDASDGCPDTPKGAKVLRASMLRFARRAGSWARRS